MSTDAFSPLVVSESHTSRRVNEHRDALKILRIASLQALA
jgi:hypothetical protein